MFGSEEADANLSSASKQFRQHVGLSEPTESEEEPTLDFDAYKLESSGDDKHDEQTSEAIGSGTPASAEPVQKDSLTDYQH